MKGNKGQGTTQYIIIGLVVISLIGSWTAFAFAGKPASTEGLAKRKDISDLRDRIATLEKRIKSLKERQSTLLEKVGTKPPAKLAVTNISVPSVKVGKTATVSVTVLNAGGKKGSKDISLKINGETVKTKHVTVAAGSSKSISFKVKKKNPGKYKISANGTTGTLAVTGKKYFFGLAAHRIANTWEAAYANSFKWYCADHGYKYVVEDGKFDQSLQVKQAKRMIDMGIDGLILAAIDKEGAKPIIRYAQKNDVPVITTNVHVDDSGVVMHISFSNWKAGVKCGRKIKEYLKEEVKPKGEVSGTILQIGIPPGHSEGALRQKGFRSVFENNKNVKILSGIGYNQAAKARKAAQPLLRKHGDEIDAIFCTGGGAPVGIKEALKAIGAEPGDYYFATLDASPPTIKMIKQGWVDVAIDQPCTFYNPLAVHYMVKYLKAGKPEVGSGGPLPDEGKTVTAEDLTVATGNKHAGINPWATPVWAPAKITDIRKESPKLYDESVLYMQTSGVTVTKQNADWKGLWGNMKLPGW